MIPHASILRLFNLTALWSYIIGIFPVDDILQHFIGSIRQQALSAGGWAAAKRAVTIPEETLIEWALADFRNTGGVPGSVDEQRFVTGVLKANNAFTSSFADLVESLIPPQAVRVLPVGVPSEPAPVEAEPAPVAAEEPAPTETPAPAVEATPAPEPAQVEALAPVEATAPAPTPIYPDTAPVAA